MIQQIKDYARCAVENKFVIGSYIGFALFPLIELIKHKTGTQIPPIGDFFYLASFLAFRRTQGGLPTYRAYKKVKRHLAENGTFDPEYRDKFSSEYCIQAGVRAAIKEAGLEKLI